MLILGHRNEVLIADLVSKQSFNSLMCLRSFHCAIREIVLISTNFICPQTRQSLIVFDKRLVESASAQFLELNSISSLSNYWSSCVCWNTFVHGNGFCNHWMTHDSHQTQTVLCELNRKNRSSGWLNKQAKQFNVWFNVSILKLQNKGTRYCRWLSWGQNPLFTIFLFPGQREDRKLTNSEVPDNIKCVSHSWGLSHASRILGEVFSRKMKWSSTAFVRVVLHFLIFGTIVFQQARNGVKISCNI
jgi:hypothetical protein